jgi:predicted permease
MKALRASLMRLFGMFASTRAERELSAEIESNLQLHIDDNLRAGMTPQEARRRAVLALGGVERTKEEYRDRRGLPAFESLVRDLRYGARTLIKNPGFALAGVIILGLGIGVNAAIFTVVNAVVLRPLPFADAHRIMSFFQTPPPTLFTDPVFPISPANFIDYTNQAQVFEKAAIYRSGRQTLTGAGEPESVIAWRTSADFLPILGVSPYIGRGFTKADDDASAPPSVLLSDAFFKSRFGGDASIVGRALTLNGVAHTVIGIVPPISAFAQRAQMFVPLAWTAKDRAIRNNHNYLAIAKLKPGVDLARAQADLDAISQRLQAAYPDDNKDWGAILQPLQQRMVGSARTSMLVLLGAAALVLLIACANLANLMLVRTHARAKEIAVRGALGASRLRVIQQLLAEGLVLGAGGGAAGFLAATYGVDALVAAFGTALPRASEITVDTRVLLFTAAIATSTGLAAAFMPAWKLSGRDASEALRTGPGRGNSGGGQGRIRNLLVVSEVSLALMLLIGAGLLMQSLSGLRAVDPGFDSRNMLTGTVIVPNAKYPTPEQRNQFFDRVLRNVRALPGVDSAAIIDNVPLQGGSSQYVAVEGQPPMKESELPVVALRAVSPEYFKTARIPVLRGRDFTDADGYGEPRAIVISERTAKRFFPNQNPIGRRITLTMMTQEPSEIVGVVGEVKMGRLDSSEADSETAIYAPAAQFAFHGHTIVMRTATAPANFTRSLMDAVRAVDAEQPVLFISTMEQIVEESLGQRPFAMLLLAMFAILALVLASIGIYSVLAYTVRQRVREIGIRMALGAPSLGVLRLVVFEGLKPTLLGVALGLVLAAALVRVLNTLLYGVDQHDPGTYSTVAVLMVIVGIAATLVPAWRATRVDPIVTLRSE